MNLQRPSTERSVRALSTQRATLAVIIVLASALGLMHAAAVHSYRMSESLPTLSQRAEAARRARGLEPFNSRFVARAELLHRWNRGAELLAAGDYNQAVAVLSDALQLAPREPGLVSLYKRAQAIQTLETNKKAHLQHGHEGPGGTLAPEDVER